MKIHCFKVQIMENKRARDNVMNMKLREAVTNNEALCSAEIPREYNHPDLENLLERDRLLSLELVWGSP